MSIEAIKVEGTRGVNEAVVLQAMQTRIGQPLERDTIDLDMRRIFGRGDFETVNYAVEEDRRQAHAGRAGQGKSRSATTCASALSSKRRLGNQADFNLLASHRMKWLNSFGGEWRNELILGRDVLVRTELYQPLSTRQYFFVAPQACGTRSIDSILYADDLRIAEYSGDSHELSGVDFGVNFLQHGEARVGALVGRRDTYAAQRWRGRFSRY